jgi:hypothetical protein
MPVTVLIRPTDVKLKPAINGHTDGEITRVAYLGPMVKADVILPSGERLVVHQSREEFTQMAALAREWGLPWPVGDESAETDVEPAKVNLEVREARVFVEDFSI